VGKSGTQSEIGSLSQYCGKKDAKVAYADGSGNNAWRQITKILFENWAKKCKNITAVQYTDAQDNTQKAISDFNSLIAQKYNVIVTFADAGQALLPTIKKATAAGVKVVPIVSGVGGTPGVDYTDFVAEDVKTYGYNLAVWTMKHMGGKGNLVMLGGTAGNQYSQTVYDGVTEALKKYPNVKLLNTTGPVATDWTVSQTQQAVAGLITKYGSINGVVSDYGGGSAGGVQAFINAKQPVPVWSANDSNSFACLWYKYKSTEPTYQIATESSRNWVVEEALNKGMAAYEGIKNTEPDTFNLGIIEDSTNPNMQPKCDSDLSPDAILSSGLSKAQLLALFPAQ
jgi:ribose transport system substrate-binding protein